MKPTPIALELIDRLRHDEHTRKHFDINSWEGKGTCGTVGCIAGTAIAMEYKFKPDVYWKEQSMFCGSFPINYTIEGARILGLDRRAAIQLFRPNVFWFWSLRGLNKPHPFKHLGENAKPSADYVAEMVKWAKSVDLYSPAMFPPDACANALEQFVVDEIPYVNWMAAHLRAEEKA